MRWICILLLLVMVVGCTDKTADPGEERPWQYPLQVGNEWNYDRYYYSLDMDTQDTLLTGHDYIEVRVIHVDDTTAQVATHVLHSRIFEEGDIFNAYDWFAHLDSGLYCFAYQGVGHGSVHPSPPQSDPDGVVYFQGIRFNHPREIARYFMDSPRTLEASEDSIYLEIPPVRSLPYPLVTNFEWDYRPLDDPFHISKKIIGREIVETPAGSFDCWVIEWKWDIDNDGNWDEDISGLEYVSSIGLVKRWFRSTFVQGPDGLEIFDAKYLLRSYVVQ